MLQHIVLHTLAAAPQPIFTNQVIESVKDFVDHWSSPQVSLPFFFFPIFVLMFVAYKWWTKPAVALLLLLGFCFFYFGAMLVSVNYLQIIDKPDNVPITMMLLGTMFCLWMAFRQASLNDTAIAAGKSLPVENKDDRVLCWPDLVYTEMICLVLAAAALIVWSVLLRAPLESPANPAGPPNPSKAPWYFLGLQEMLVYFDPWMAGVLLPGLIITGLISMPYIDTNPKGNGYYTLAQRKFSIFVWLFGFLILWVVLIVFGTFLRGPNWNFFGPFQYWDSHLQVPLTNVNLSDYFWVFGLKRALPTAAGGWGPMYMFVRELPGLIFTAFWVLALPPILARFVMRKLYMQMGSIRFYIMAFHLVILILLPLKMILRWLCNLKYFVYLPEFNLNL